MRFLKMTSAVAAGLIALSTGAFAQVLTRTTFVSAGGSDGANCTRFSPCRTFAGAIQKTASDGVITAIGAGDFGPVTITKPITLVGTPGLATIVGTSSPLIAIQVAPTAAVNLIGLQLDGLGSASKGIEVFTDIGDAAPLASGGRIVITDSVIANVSGTGITISGSGGARLLLRDSLILSNGVGGMLVEGLGTKGVIVEGTTFDLNGSHALKVDGTGAVAIVSDTSMLRSPNGLTIVNGASVTSYTNNRIRNGNPPTATVPTN